MRARAFRSTIIISLRFYVLFSLLSQEEGRLLITANIKSILLRVRTCSFLVFRDGFFCFLCFVLFVDCEDFVERINSEQSQLGVEGFFCSLDSLNWFVFTDFKNVTQLNQYFFSTFNESKHKILLFYQSDLFPTLCLIIVCSNFGITKFENQLK